MEKIKVSGYGRKMLTTYELCQRCFLNNREKLHLLCSECLEKYPEEESSIRRQYGLHNRCLMCGAYMSKTVRKTHTVCPVCQEKMMKEDAEKILNTD